MARPAFKPTVTQRRTVAIVAGSGCMSHEEIAISLGISRSTLERYFAIELSEGAYAARTSVLSAMYRSAIKGSAAAQKAYLALAPRLAAPPLPKVGKKAQAQAEAPGAHFGTDWADLLSKPHKLQ